MESFKLFYERNKVTTYNIVLKMNNNLKMIAIIVFGVIVLYIFQTKSEHNLNKSISACVVAQQQTTKSFDPKQAKEFCKKEVKKKVKN